MNQFSKRGNLSDHMKATHWILVVLLFALILRAAIPLVAVSISPDDRSVFHNKDDTGSYLGPAIGLAESGNFGRDGKPEILRSPGYPLFLVPGLWIGEVELVTIVLQIILNCMTIFLVYKIAILLFEKPIVGVLSAALYAIDPSTLIQTSVLQTETLFAFTLVLFIYLLLRYLKDNSLRELALSGVIASMCVFVRPLAYFMPVTIALFLLIRGVYNRSLHRRLLIHVCLFLAVAMTPVLGWQLRNWLVADYSGFSLIGGKDLYYDAASAILADKAGISVKDQKVIMGYNNEDVYFRLHPEQRGWTEHEIVNYQMQEAVRTILSHPHLFLKYFAHRIAWTLVGPGLSEWLYVFNVRFQNIDKILENKKDVFRLLKGSSLTLWASVLLALLLGLYWLLAGVGLLTNKTYANEGVILIVLLACYYVCLPAAAGIGYARFRHPIIPIMCVLAGKGLAYVFDEWRMRQLRAR